MLGVDGAGAGAGALCLAERDEVVRPRPRPLGRPRAARRGVESDRFMVSELKRTGYDAFRGEMRRHGVITALLVGDEVSHTARE